MAGTHVYYNGVLLRDCETKEYSQVIEYDESGSEVMYSRIRLTVASTIVSLSQSNYSAMPAAAIPNDQQHFSTVLLPDVLGETLVDRFEEVQMRLQHPRKDFWMAINYGTPLHASFTDPPIASPMLNQPYRLMLVATGEVHGQDEFDAGGNLVPNSTSEHISSHVGQTDVLRKDVLDVDHGPRPQRVDVQQVYGGNVMRVEFSIEICRVLSKPVDDSEEPGYDAQRVQGVISNKWSITDDYDGNSGAVSHRIEGTMRVKDHRYKANAMRIFAFPLPFPYAKLEHRSYAVDKTGLTLQYTFVFRHAGAAPPPGVRHFEARYTEAQNYGNSGTGVQTGTMQIKVLGEYHRNDDVNPITHKQQMQLLLRGAFTILASRIRGLNKRWNPLPGQEEATAIMDSLLVTEHVGHPELEVHAQVHYVPEDTSEFTLRLNNIGSGLEEIIADHDPRWWPVPGVWGRETSEDVENPFFRSLAYPYRTQGQPGESDYFTGYFSVPGSHRRTVPRITTGTENEPDNDDSTEWAEPGGYIPAGAGSSGSPSSDTVYDYHPSHYIAGGVYPASSQFSAIELVNGLYDDRPGADNTGITPLTIGTLPPQYPIGTGVSGVSTEQKSGYWYLQWDSEVANDRDEGMVFMPLSGVRDAPSPPGGSGSGGSDLYPAGKQSAVALRLHAGIAKRIYSVTAKRIGKHAVLPEPRVSFRSPNLYQEILLKQQIVSDTPVLHSDGYNLVYTVHLRYEYGLSFPFGRFDEQGYVGPPYFETLPVGSSQLNRTEAETAVMPIAGPDRVYDDVSGIGRIFQPDL